MLSIAITPKPSVGRRTKEERGKSKEESSTDRTFSPSSFLPFSHPLWLRSSLGRLAAAIILLYLLAGCAYYNYFYNAQKFYRQAEKQRRNAPSGERAKKGPTTTYDKVIESAGRMLLYYPGSRWEDDALLLVAKAYYRAGKFRSTVAKVDELSAKYPQSPFLQEGSLWKGLSLLRLAQPDSGQLILSRLFLETSSAELVAEGHLGLGEFYYGEKRYDVALDQFRSVVQTASAEQRLKSEAWVRAGECLSLMQHYGKAVELYDEILGENIPRRLRFEASLQRASALRLSDRVEEALLDCQQLLKDGAFVDELPRVELETARCLRSLGRSSEAREKLEKLVESEKRGEVGAQSQFELGLLLWQDVRDDAGALEALWGVKSTERTATVAPAADSLAAEIESLVKHYRRLRFIERQLALADSARAGLRNITAIDTARVDTSAAVKGEKKTDKGARKSRRDAASLDGDPNDPIRKMVEAAMAADTTNRDTVAAAPPSTPADTTRLSLDSLQVAGVDSLRRVERRAEWLSLAELHLFDRGDEDSARLYLQELLLETPTPLEWARGVATLAFIARSQGDTTASDSLYRLILKKPPDDLWRARTERLLGTMSKSPPVTRAAALIDSAEAAWRDHQDAEMARLIYLLAAEVADTGDTAAGRALLAAAYITRTVIGQDSLAGVLYADVARRFPNTSYSRAAAKHIPRTGGAKPAGKEAAEPAEKMPSGRDIEFEASGTIPSAAVPAEPIVYAADKVDELPQLLTLPDIVENYLRSYYPFEAFTERARGRVELQLVVRSDGTVSDIEVIKADPEGFGFDEAARQVMPSLQYRPGRLKGRPVDVRIKQTLEFKPPDDR